MIESNLTDILNSDSGDYLLHDTMNAQPNRETCDILVVGA